MSANHEAVDPSAKLESLRPLGSTTAMLVAGVLGLFGLGATAVLGLGNPKETMISYLFGFAWCAALLLGSFFMLLIFTAAGARWFVVVKRGVETMSSPMPLLALLSLPLFLFGKQLYSWLTPEALDAQGHEMLAAKSWWLNPTGFYVRAVIYFALFIFVQARLASWSRQQDSEGSAALTRKMRRLATGILPLMALAYTAAALDWLMVIDITFTSTMFGVYYWAGGFIGALSLFVFVSANSHGEHSYTQLMKKDHWHNLGKLMLAFTVFWTYIAFSQMMLIWIANQPEEIPYYTVRMTGPWLPYFWLLVVVHFPVPFFTLLSRDLKLNPQRLKLIALWIVGACLLDSYWMVMPTYYPAGPLAALHWTAFTAPLGIGGLLIAFALFRQRGSYAVPVGDPYLDDSLRYSQP